MKLQMQGSEHIRALPEAVRRFVTDPAQVGRCLPDLQELDVVDHRRLVAFVRVGVGPVRGRFKLEVDLGGEGEGLTMRLKGSGMGSGLQMQSRMRLTPAGEGTTVLDWDAEAAVSGPLASVGGRLLDAQARKTTQQLFDAIRRNLESGGQVAAR
jgi:carbon monoxide dehydrogenase subunit G